MKQTSTQDNKRVALWVKRSTRDSLKIVAVARGIPLVKLTEEILKKGAGK